MSDIMDAYRQMPVIARTLATAIFVSSIALYTGFLPGHWIYFHYTTLFQLPPAIWRPFTSFLITQPKLAIILDPYFVYSYVSQLEQSNPRFSRKEDVVWYLVIVSAFIITIDSLLGMFSGFYLQGLILALAYTGTQDQRGVKTNFFFVTIPAQLVPYSMMLVALLMVGPEIVKLQLVGLVSAHLYDFITRLWPEFGGGSNWLPTPAFLSRLAPNAGNRVEHRTFGTAIRSSGTSTGSSGGSGPLPDSWRTRGSGHRLGGD